MMDVLAKINEEIDGTATEATLLDDLGLDSLEFAELLVDLNVPWEKAPEIQTIADLIREAR